MLTRSRRRSLLLVLLVALVAGALLGVSCHLIWADHSHDPSSCAVCAWFHFKGWITAALVLLVSVGLRHFAWIYPADSGSLAAVACSARAPPRR